MSDYDFGRYRLHLCKRQNVDTEAPVLQVKTDTIKADIQATDAELMHGITAEDNMDGDVSDTLLVESIT